MKSIMIIVMLAATVPAFAAPDATQASPAPSALKEKLSKRRAKLAAMSPEERAAYFAKRKAEAAAAKAAERMAIIERLKKAKAACGPECYRVVSSNGVFIGLTKAQYDEWAATHHISSAFKDGARKKRKATRSPDVKAPPRDGSRHYRKRRRVR